MTSDHTSRKLVDAELVEFLDTLPTVEISESNLQEYREFWVTDPLPLPCQNGAEEAAVRVSVRSVRDVGRDEDISFRVYEPARNTAPVGAIFHIHGGGYISGESATLEPAHRELSAQLGCVLVSVDYRVAPETQYPGNVNDCYAALAWLVGHARDLNVDPSRIGVMGESAGGGLAAALALLVRDRGEFPIAFQHLIYPMLDDRTGSTGVAHPYTGGFVWTAQNNQFGWLSLLGVTPGAAGVSAYAAPARAESLVGLPQAFISTAALDLFLEENIEYARRLTRAGVPVELHVYPGAFHGFDLHPTAAVARAARRDSLAALTRFLKAQLSETR